MALKNTDLTICPGNVDLRVKVEFDYTPAEKGVMYDSNMTGTPDSPAECEITHVWHEQQRGFSIDIIDYLDDDVIAEIQEKILTL